MSHSDTRTPASGGFEAFDLGPELQRGITDAGFIEPRPIQTRTIPAALAGRDVLGLAQTGTGKTAAFALPLAARLLGGSDSRAISNGRRSSRGGRRAEPRALILAPTRELANQIDAEIRLLSKHTPLRTVTIFGGVSANAQISALRRGAEIVVGCPGRVLDLLQQGELRLGSVEVLVLDEADHMFDMGFLPDVRRIMRAIPRERQNLLFSATMPKDIRGLADEVLVNPHVARLTDDAPAELVDHALYPIHETEKRALLEHMLVQADCHSAIVFTRTKHRAKRLAGQLTKAGHRAVALQGNMSQNQRDRAMSGFRRRRYDILVATDIAARGIDVSNVSHVINYDVPNTPEAYTHRIGRTGRAEREGIACTFVSTDDRAWVRATEKMIGETIPRRQVQGFGNGVALEQGGNETRRGKPRRSGGGPRSGTKSGGGSRSGNKSGGRGRGRGSTSSPAPASAARSAPERKKTRLGRRRGGR